MRKPKYSVIIPVYNRPQELNELLDSLTRQTFTDFEVVVVEDGSSLTSQKVVENYSDRLAVNYLFKPNAGPGPARNFGFTQARGDYFIVFDSDCIIPRDYFSIVDSFLISNPLDAWGGPDRGHESFTVQQQAMAYTMSSVLTTGGIRGNKKYATDFQPRSFNMGIKRETFERTGGFKFDRHAEDIELSIRMKKLGLKVGLIPEAIVFHKRRTDLKQFFKQVMGFGKGRVLVGRANPRTIKLTHWLPALFLIGVASIPILCLIKWPLGMMVFLIYLLYFVAIGVDALRNTKSVAIALYSIPSACVQLCGYGAGFLKEILKSYM